MLLQFGGQFFNWDFLLAEVAFPILGVDFLRGNHLSVDPAAGEVRQVSSGRVLPIFETPAQCLTSVSAASGGQPSVTGLPSTSSSPSPSASPSSSPSGEQVDSSSVTGPHSSGVPHTADCYKALLQQYQDVVNPNKVLPPATGGVEHHIETTGRPVSARFRRLDQEKLAAAKTEFEQLEREGIIRRSSSCWASPLHMVKKPNGDWRPCGDYRRLNLITAADKYPLPNMLDFAARLRGCKVFSKLDLRKGYHQIPMNPDDIKKTAIITPFGLWEFLRMPFGLMNASMTFQRHMDRVTGDLYYTFTYLDDVIVASPDESTHLQHLQEVLGRFRQHGLVLNEEKCLFGQAQVEFLGHLVSAKGAEPLQRHVTAVRRFPAPSTVKELQAFLGLLNFYRRFLPRIAKTLAPLTEELKGGRKGSEQLSWSSSLQSAFQQAKDALCTATSLSHPDQNAHLSLWVDASASHVGAVLQQRPLQSQQDESAWEPLGFFSRKLSTTEVKYSAFDRELLGCRDGIRHFRHMLEGRPFTIFTDHKPLVHALSQIGEPWSARQSRHLAEVAEYTSDLRHVAGVDNLVADTMSRPPIHSSTPPPAPVVPAVDKKTTVQSAEVATVKAVLASFNYREMAAAQQSCDDVTHSSSLPSLLLKRVLVEGVHLLCDTSTGASRPLVPVSHRRQVFEVIHQLAHAGTRATKRMLASRFVWKGLRADVTRWCRECQECNRGKVTTQLSAPVQTIPVPTRRFSHIHLDLVGPLPVSKEGNSHLMTLIDRTSRWLEVVPLASTSARVCADTLVNCWISRFGVPETITTDRGVQFTSELWSVLCSTLGINHITTTSYHPQSNGMIERTHRQLKDSLRARAAGVDWQEHLPWVLLGLRSAPKEDSGLSSAELVFGCKLTLPGELLCQGELTEGTTPRREEGEPRIPVRAVPASEAGPTAAELVPDSVQFVYIRKGGKVMPLSPLYEGPYKVLKRSSNVWTIDIGGRPEAVAVTRLKPHRGSAPVELAQPPKRGRPKKIPVTSTTGSGH